MDQNNSDDENILKEFEELEDNQNEVPEADAPTIFIIDQTASEFNNPNSNIATLAEKFQNPKLNLIATKLHSLFSTSEVGLKFNRDDLQKIEKGICVFVDEVLKLNSQNTNNQEKNNSFENQDSMKNIEADNDRLQKQVSDLRRQIDDLTKRAKTAEDSFENVKIELDTLREDKETLEETANKKSTEILGLRKELDTTTAELKDKIDSLEDQLRNEKDMTQMNANQLERYENQLNDANEELALLKTEKVTWKSKQENQSAKISKLKQQLNEAKLRIQELEADNQATEAANNDLKRNLEDSTMRLKDVDSSEIQNLQEANKYYHNLVDRFNGIFEEQNKDKEDLVKNHKRAIDLLMEQQNLLAQYEDELEILNRDKNDLEVQATGDARLIRNLREKLAKLEEELNNYKSDEESNQLAKIRQMLKPRFGEDADISQTVQGLLNGTTDNEMKQMNQSLFQIIDNILSFWTKIINEGNVKNVLKTTATSLSSISRNATQKQIYKEDETVKNDLLVQIARYRQAASQNSAFEASQFPSTDSLEKILNRLQNSDSEFDQQTYYIIASGAMVNDVLRNLYERANSSYKAVIADLQPAVEVLNFDTEKNEIKDLPKHIIEKLNNYRAFKDKITKICDPEDYNPEIFDDFLKFLYHYITNSSAILNSIDSDLRQLVDDKNRHQTELEEEEEENTSNLDLQGVVDRAVEMLTDFLNHDTTSENPNPTEVRERDILTQSFDEDRDKMRNQIEQLTNEAESTLQATRELEKENNELRSKIDELTKQNEEEKRKNQDLTEKYDKLSVSQDTLEQNNDELRNENKSLREAMDNKSRLFDKRVNQLMDEERKQHKEDLNNAKERAMKREEKLQQELAEKSEKVKKLKAQLKQYLNQYEQAFKKQKETTAVLKKQNEELNAKLSKVSENTSSQKENDRLRAEVKTLETEKLLLSAKLKSAQESAEKIQASRDNYWMAQMTVRETELNKSINDVTQQANDHFDNFFDQVISTLETYLPLQSRVDEDTVIETLSKVVQRLETAENAVLNNNKENENNNNSNFVNSPSTSKYEERNTSILNNSNSDVNSKALVALREWDRWARDLFVNFTDGEVPCQSCKELRFVLGEMILTSISNRKVIFRMESLRAQKRFLLRYFSGGEEVPEFKDPQEEPIVSMRPVMILVLAQFHIMKKYGYPYGSTLGVDYQSTITDRSGQQSKKSTPKSSKSTPKKKSFF